MTLQQISLLVLEAAGWLLVLSFIAVALLRSREERLKYKLYSLRDDLLYLAASHKLSQDSLIFRAFYAAITDCIAQVRNLTLYSFVRASISARTAIQKEKRECLREEIENAPPDVRAFVERFARVMMDIMLANSPALRILIFAVSRCGRIFRYAKQWIVPPQAYEAYQTYRYFEGLRSSLTPRLALSR